MDVPLILQHYFTIVLLYNPRFIIEVILNFSVYHSAELKLVAVQIRTPLTKVPMIFISVELGVEGERKVCVSCAQNLCPSEMFVCPFVCLFVCFCLETS